MHPRRSLLLFILAWGWHTPLSAQSYFWDFEGAGGLAGWKSSTGLPLTTGAGLSSATSIIVPTAFGAGDSTVFIYHAVPFDPAKSYIANCWTRSGGGVLPSRTVRMAWVDTVTHQYYSGGSSISSSWSYANWTYLELASQPWAGSGVYCIVISLSAVSAQNSWIDNVSVDEVPNTNVIMGVLAWLGGNYATGSNTMSENLRSAGLLPATEPYTALGYPQLAGGGGEWCAPALLGNSISYRAVDWVRIELRSAANPSVIVATRQAILDQHGIARGYNGQTLLSFDVPQGSYYVAVRHRNHLGCMSAAAVTLGGLPFPSGVNFRSTSTPTWGINARKVVGSAAVLWPGDANGDGVVMYTGANNDRDVVLNAIGGVIPTNVVLNVYDRRDVTLNGAITYTGGSSNDRDLILQTIGGIVPTVTRMQQIP